MKDRKIACSKYNFFCRRCDKEKSGCLAFATQFSISHELEPCSDCGKTKRNRVFAVEELGLDEKETYVGCLECNPVMDDKDIQYADRVCCECFFEWRLKKRQNGVERNDLLTKLTKKIQELKQQSIELKKQLAEVSEELKKLKNSSAGQNKNELDQQIVKNERLIKNEEDNSLAKIQEQVNKSRFLVQLTQQIQKTKKVNDNFSEKNDVERDKKSSFLAPYLLGGLTVIVSGLVLIGWWLLIRKIRKKWKIKN